MILSIVDAVLNNHSKVDQWLTQLESNCNLPFYSSVDIRDAGFKMAFVDTNLFPAGFNNLCQLALKDACQTFKKAILHRVSNAKQLLMIIEEHTRNTWYLENVYVLEHLMKSAGFEVTIASFLTQEMTPKSEDAPYITLKTAKKNALNLYCLHTILEDIKTKKTVFDLIILNHDLTTGIPDILQQTQVPIYPSIQAGWHSRLKSNHFSVANTLLDEFASMIDIDPWFFSCLYTAVESVDINTGSDRERLHAAVKRLFETIQEKYDIHKIDKKPFVFLKSDSGTYGMGVMPIESPDDVLTLNRKSRNTLSKGKSSQSIGRFILQEGVPSIGTVDGLVSEVCIYQVANQFVGGFYRLNNKKNDRENLNSSGMRFKKMCIGDRGECLYHHENINECGVEPDPKTRVYHILARLAGIAAHREIVKHY